MANHYYVRAAAAVAATLLTAVPVAAGSEHADDEAGLETLAQLPEGDDRVVWAAVQAAIARCMTERGMDYPVEAYPQAGSEASAARPLYPDPDWVQTHGFDWMMHADLPQPPVPPSSLIDDPAYHAALAECHATVSTQLGRDEFDAAQTMFFDGAANVGAMASTLPEAIALEEQLMSCVREHGFDVRDSRELQWIAIQLGDGDFTAPEAIPPAVAYWTCREQVRYMETSNELVQRLTDEWIETHPGAFEELERARAELVRRSIDYLESIDVSVPN